jgi:hypothetical protein
MLYQFILFLEISDLKARLLAIPQWLAESGVPFTGVVKLHFCSRLLVARFQ